MQRYLFIAAILFSGAVNAAPITIDFEEFSLGETGALNTPCPEVAIVCTGSAYVESQGFRISYIVVQTSPVFVATGTGSIQSGISGSQSLRTDSATRAASPSCPPILENSCSNYYKQFQIGINVTRTDGGAFSLLDLDAFVIGLATDPVIAISRPGSFSSLSTPLGTGEWLNITEFSIAAWDGGPATSAHDFYLEVDNIVVGAAVPIPATVWLFASGLGLLGWLRKRRIVTAT